MRNSKGMQQANNRNINNEYNDSSSDSQTNEVQNDYDLNKLQNSSNSSDSAQDSAMVDDQFQLNIEELPNWNVKKKIKSISRESERITSGHNISLDPNHEDKYSTNSRAEYMLKDDVGNCTSVRDISKTTPTSSTHHIRNQCMKTRFDHLLDAAEVELLKLEQKKSEVSTLQRTIRLKPMNDDGLDKLMVFVIDNTRPKLIKFRSIAQKREFLKAPYNNASHFDKRIQIISSFTDFDDDLFIVEKEAGGVYYRCGLLTCRSRFKSLCLTKRHYFEHTGVKPYKCRNENCFKRFSRKDNMILHYRNCNKDNPNKNHPRG